MMTAADTDDTPPADRRKSRRFGLFLLLILMLLLTMGAAILWMNRTPIAEDFVQRELAARGVRASYKVTQIAFKTQRIENLVLGDPARPDLTARSVEVDIAYGSLVPRVGVVRARGVRLYGRMTDKGLDLGELDKFRDPASTAPFGMPDIDLTLDDARARIETPAGPFGLVINGKGNLKSGFTGKAGALIRNATAGGCSLPRATAWLDVRMTNGAPRLSGPVRADAVRCGGALGAAELALKTDVTLSPELDRWRGRVAGGAEAARGSGMTVARPGIDMRFDGDAKAMQGQGLAHAAALRSGDMHAGRSEIRARWSWKGGAARADGDVAMADIRAVDPKMVRALAGNAASTPVGPLLAQLADGVAAVQSGSRMNGRFFFDHGPKGGGIRFPALALTGSNGARIGLSGDSSFAVSLPDRRWSLDGALTSGGGGLPEMALRLRQEPGGGMAGQMFLQPYEARGARLEAEPVRFTAVPGGATRIVTRLRLDGPMPDGAVRGLELPVLAEWGPRGLIVNPSCVQARFAALKASSLRLDGTALRLCPVDGALFALHGGVASGGAVIDRPRLSGRLGDSALGLSARSARYALRSGGFELVDPDMRIGGQEAPVLLSASRLTGVTLARGLGGQASGLAGRIGTVPLLVRDGEARWAFVDGALALNGAMIVHDDANPDRFNPLQSSDFRLTLANGRIDAAGSLHLPGRMREIVSVSIRHMLGSGAGHADLLVNDLRFDRQLQPDEITHMALGVVANVQGSVTGGGRIDWTGERVTSTGEFATEGMNLAAAFGPVQGLSTRIRFTDLIGLVSEPGQEMRLVSVHPGIEVHNGVIRYALLPGQRVAIEGGHWPFAGGDLTLLPTVMDMSAEKPRNLTFRVIGLDAGAFIQTLELDNVSATGTFDGLLPMVFDAEGGRIVGGVLTARQSGMPPLVIDHVEGLDIPCDRNRQGGTLSYVGQVSNENLGRMGKLAFDALKDLQYKCLTILMDGAIDGEVVTQVAFNGVNRGELSNVPKPIASQFVGLPFIFNVTIAAPFRGLMNTAKSFIDPSLLIRQQMGDKFAPVKQNRLAVQPRESETVTTGERE